MVKHYADSDVNGNIIAFYNDDIWDVTKIPTTAIPITEEQWQDAIANQGKYIITNKDFVLAPPPTADQQLATAKIAKIAELDAACTNALQTFTSSALGTPHTYLSGRDDMIILSGEYSFVKGDDYDGLPILWYTVESGNVDHTKAQFVQVYLDGRKSVANAKYHRAALDPQINAATTIAAVNAIVW